VLHSHTRIEHDSISPRSNRHLACAIFAVQTRVCFPAQIMSTLWLENIIETMKKQLRIINLASVLIAAILLSYIIVFYYIYCSFLRFFSRVRRFFRPEEPCRESALRYPLSAVSPRAGSLSLRGIPCVYRTHSRCILGMRA